MKFTVSKALISDALGNVQTGAGKSTMPILANVKIEAKDGQATFVTTDLDFTAVATIPCNVIEEGATTLPAKLLMSAISRAADGDISIEVSKENERAVIQAGVSLFRINGLPAADFPRLPEEDGDEAEFTIPQGDLKSIMRRTMYAMTDDDTRRALRGINFKFSEGKLKVAATDGRRLAYAEYAPQEPYAFELDFILPSKCVCELVRNLGTAGDAVFTRRKTLIRVKISDSLVLYSKLIDDAYPPYNRVIPTSNDKTVVVDRMQLIGAIERVSVFADGNTLKLNFANNNLTLTSANTEVGDAKDDVPVKYDGEPIEARYNHYYLLDVLKASDDDDITFLFNEGTTPVIIKDSGAGMAVVMPLRVN